MDKWICYKSLSCLNDNEVDFLKNSGLLAYDVLSFIEAIRSGRCIHGDDSTEAVNHFKAFIKLAWNIRDQRENNIICLFRQFDEQCYNSDRQTDRQTE